MEHTMISALPVDVLAECKGAGHSDSVTRYILRVKNYYAHEGFDFKMVLVIHGERVIFEQAGMGRNPGVC
jgi:hypothetical protein